MQTTILWESPLEEKIKDSQILGVSAWQKTLDLFCDLGLTYREANKLEKEVFKGVFSGGLDSVDQKMLSKKAVLYFMGHYPLLNSSVLHDFIQKASSYQTAILYSNSLGMWEEEKQIICYLWQPEASLEEKLERTLNEKIYRLDDLGKISFLEKEINYKRNLSFVTAGVKIMDVHSTIIGEDVQICAGVILWPNTIILGNSKIEKECEIGPNCQIKDSYILQGCQIRQSVIENSQIGKECNIGPFSYIRPNSVVGDRVRIGDFVEIKNSTIGQETMISHLTYVGDADVGKNVNFGCGTILVNFDGKIKHRSIIEDNVFIGCNTNLVSPVHISQGAFIAAGSTITNDLPANSLGIARARQQIKENWVTNRRDIDKGGK